MTIDNKVKKETSGIVKKVENEIPDMQKQQSKEGLSPAFAEPYNPDAVVKGTNEGMNNTTETLAEISEDMGFPYRRQRKVQTNQQNSYQNQEREE